MRLAPVFSKISNSTFNATVLASAGFKSSSQKQIKRNVDRLTFGKHLYIHWPLRTGKETWSSWALFQSPLSELFNDSAGRCINLFPTSYLSFTSEVCTVGPKLLRLVFFSPFPEAHCQHQCNECGNNPGSSIQYSTWRTAQQLYKSTMSVCWYTTNVQIKW